ncbi:MAG: hypothetical protein LiPW15_193 [Parcubacteria group bacterium LiPW_15]|nr:MAG: hypothetical protein LiPW15_193 [Parcubacteria group bacterium LiPW_15]
MSYFTACLTAMIVSVVSFMLYHRIFHYLRRQDPRLNPVGYCENQRHGRSFRFFSALAFTPFFFVTFISPFLLEYQSRPPNDLLYRKVGGKYHWVTFATRDDSCILRVPSETRRPNEPFFFLAEKDGKIREATIWITFTYIRDPEVFERVFRAGAYDPNHKFGSPMVRRLFYGFMIRNGDEIREFMTSVDFASPGAREELEEKVEVLMAKHLQYPGMLFGVSWVDIREF